MTYSSAPLSPLSSPFTPLTSPPPIRYAVHRVVDGQGTLHGATIVSLHPRTHHVVSLSPFDGTEQPSTQWIGGSIILSPYAALPASCARSSASPTPCSTAPSCCAAPSSGGQSASPLLTLPEWKALLQATAGKENSPLASPLTPLTPPHYAWHFATTDWEGTEKVKGKRL